MAKYTVEMVGHVDDYPQFNHQQTMQLIEEYQQTKKPALKEQLVFANLKLVLSLVQKYHQRTNNLDDLFQVGIIGLMKAIDNFNTQFQVRFSTYAVPLIVGEIKRYLRDNSPLHIPRSMRDLAYKAMIENEKYMKMHNKEADVKELSQLLQVDEGLLIEALSSTHNVTSLSQDIQNDGNAQIEMLSQIPNPKNEMEMMNDYMDLNAAMDHLSHKEKQIINQRYFEDLTQSEIASELMISQAQVSRLEKQALSHLLKYMQVHDI